MRSPVRVAQVLALLGLPRHIVAARSMTTVNDPIKGRHDYLAELTQEMAEAIEHHYSADFDAFGFVRLSLGLRGEGVEAAPPSWVARACAPLCVSVAACEPESPLGESFNQSNWPGPLVCRGTARKLASQL